MYKQSYKYVLDIKNYERVVKMLNSDILWIHTVFSKKNPWYVCPVDEFR